MLAQMLLELDRDAREACAQEVGHATMRARLIDDMRDTRRPIALDHAPTLDEVELMSRVAAAMDCRICTDGITYSVVPAWHEDLIRYLDPSRRRVSEPAPAPVDDFDRAVA